MNVRCRDRIVVHTTSSAVCIVLQDYGKHHTCPEKNGDWHHCCRGITAALAVCRGGNELAV